MIYSQRDPKWGKDKMGNSGLKLEDYGCLCTSIAMLDGRTPKEINKILSQGGAYNSNGILDHNKASSLLGLNFEGHSSTPQYFPIIAEVDMSPSPGKQQHFVIQESPESILDPWTGTRRSHKTYPIISYRLYKKITQDSMKIPSKLQDEIKKYQDLLKGQKEYEKEVKYKFKDELREDDLMIIKELQSGVRNMLEDEKKSKKNFIEMNVILEEKISILEGQLGDCLSAPVPEDHKVVELEHQLFSRDTFIEDLQKSFDVQRVTMQNEIVSLKALVDKNAKDTSILDALSFAIKAILNR